MPLSKPDVITDAPFKTSFRLNKKGEKESWFYTHTHTQINALKSFELFQHASYVYRFHTIIRFGHSHDQFLFSQDFIT